MANSKFTGKVVWITGASSGIGEALAAQFAKTGSRLILSARRKNELVRVAAACSGAESVTVLPLDLSEPDFMAGTAQQALAANGHIDVMVHNAGVGQRAFGADTDYNVDELIMRTNYLGPVALTKALLPSMRARREGHFIVLSSVLAKFGLPGRSAYCASKHALHGFFDTLRAELWKDGIKVTLILPSWVRTNVSINALNGRGGHHGKMDPGTASGYPPEVCAQKILAAAESGKSEVTIAKLQERAVLYLNRFSPSILHRILRGRPL
jgi:short-subunit dehydrogenase